jgi:hypothetical protein
MTFTILTTLFVLVSLPRQTFSQQQTPSVCTMPLAQSPEIRGLKLGLSGEQIMALIPENTQWLDIRQTLEKAKGYPNYGVANLSIQLVNYGPVVKDRFAGIDWISITLFDERVTSIHIVYSGPGSYPRGASWPNVDDFIAKLTQPFALPAPKDWLEKSESSKILKCNGWEIEASTEGRSASISLRSQASYREIVRQRATADEERRRKEFKP